MLERLCLILCVSLVAAGSLSAQIKSVTNVDLEKYRQKRLAAEKEYRENYARLGLPSPEELDRRREESKIENARLAERLAKERIDRENAEAAALQYQAEQLRLMNQQPLQTVTYPAYGYGYGTYGYSGYGGYGYPYYGRYPGRFRGYYVPQGYYAGGAFWPTTNGPLRPAFARPRPPAPPRPPRR